MTAVVVSVLSGVSDIILPNKVSPHIDSNPEDSYRFILCLYKSLSKTDLSLLKQYGRVVHYSDQFRNIDCQLIPFDYFILDFRITEEIIYYQKCILSCLDKYRVILYRYAFETNNGIRVHNEITELPQQEALKKDFDYLLLQEPISSPCCCVSLYRILFGKTQVQVS